MHLERDGGDGDGNGRAAGAGRGRPHDLVTDAPIDGQFFARKTSDTAPIYRVIFDDGTRPGR
jgi:hypothetical protein